MTKNFIDDLAVKRVTNGDELESTTLRSDLVARYLFLNETLLQGLNVVKTSPLVREGLSLRETITNKDGETINDEEQYLKDLVTSLEGEVEQLKQQQQQQQKQQQRSDHDSKVVGVVEPSPEEDLLRELGSNDLTDTQLEELQRRWERLSGKRAELSSFPIPAAQEVTTSTEMGLDLGMDLGGLDDVDVSDMLGEIVDL